MAVVAGISSRMPNACGPIELQVAIDLEKVEVGPDLDRPVAGVADLRVIGRPAGVDLDIAVGQDQAADWGRIRILRLRRRHACAATTSATPALRRFFSD